MKYCYYHYFIEPHLAIKLSEEIHKEDSMDFEGSECEFSISPVRFNISTSRYVPITMPQSPSDRPPTLCFLVILKPFAFLSAGYSLPSEMAWKNHLAETNNSCLIKMIGVLSYSTLSQWRTIMRFKKGLATL
jgi:hypothetical protein